MKRVLLIIFASIIVYGSKAQVKGQDYTVNNNGDVVIAQIVEGLVLKKDEIYGAALNYMKSAYKDTKYTIVINSLENGEVTGEG